MMRPAAAPVVGGALVAGALMSLLISASAIDSGAVFGDTAATGAQVSTASLSPITGLTATRGQDGTTVALGWSPSPLALTYRLERADADGVFVELGVVSTPSASDLVDAGAHEYRVTALRGNWAAPPAQISLPAAASAPAARSGQAQPQPTPSSAPSASGSPTPTQSPSPEGSPSSSPPTPQPVGLEASSGTAPASVHVAVADEGTTLDVVRAVPTSDGGELLVMGFAGRITIADTTFSTPLRSGSTYGHSVAVVRLNAAGEVQWSSLMNSEALSLAATSGDGADGLYLVGAYVGTPSGALSPLVPAGATGAGYVLHLDAQGSSTWAQSLGEGAASAVVGDGDDVYVAGHGPQGAYLRSLDSTGVAGWHLDSTGIQISALALDSTSLYLAGSYAEGDSTGTLRPASGTVPGSSARQGVVAQLARSGALNWSQPMVATAGADLNALTVGSVGQDSALFVAGTFSGTVTSSVGSGLVASPQDQGNVVVSRLGLDGAPTWSRTGATVSGSPAGISGLALGKNLVVSGRGCGGVLGEPVALVASGCGQDGALAGLDPTSGSPVWQARTSAQITSVSPSGSGVVTSGVYSGTPDGLLTGSPQAPAAAFSLR